MIGRHRKKRPEPAPVLSVVLASAFAGAVALAPLDGGSGEAGGPSEPARAVAGHSDQKSDQPSKRPSGRAEQRSARPADDPPSEPPAECDPSDAGSKHPNGRIPQDDLCPLPQRGESLRADAAAAFYKLNVAYHKRFGEQMCVRSSYRSYEKQRQLYQRMPAGMAARPGNSKHGNGIAVDLCGGVQNGGSPQFKWLEANSKKYGWIHPAWAYSSPYEPWHWEYRG